MYQLGLRRLGEFAGDRSTPGQSHCDESNRYGGSRRFRAAELEPGSRGPAVSRLPPDRHAHAPDLPGVGNRAQSGPLVHQDSPGHSGQQIYLADRAIGFVPSEFRFRRSALRGDLRGGRGRRAGQHHWFSDCRRRDRGHQSHHLLRVGAHLSPVALLGKSRRCLGQSLRSVQYRRRSGSRGAHHHWHRRYRGILNIETGSSGLNTGCFPKGLRARLTGEVPMYRLLSFVFAVGYALAQPTTLTYPGISTVRPSGSGGRVAWSKVLNLVAYDRVSSDGYYDVHVMNPDGSTDQCLTCGQAALPPGHKGDPDFDFSGKWIIFQAEKPGTPTGFDTLASPGSGLFNDVWMMDVAGTQFYQLTDVPATNSGVLHPHFSHSGNQITWAQLLNPLPLPLGTWEVQIAGLVFTNGTPSLQNITSYQPGAMPRFYETHGFSSDDQSVYFSGDPDVGQEWYGLDIYVFTPATPTPVNLANTPTDWDEHADLSPDGTHILWGSSTGIQLVSGDSKLDYWIMENDGYKKPQLPWYNETGFPTSE